MSTSELKMLKALKSVTDALKKELPLVHMNVRILQMGWETPIEVSATGNSSFIPWFEARGVTPGEWYAEPPQREWEWTCEVTGIRFVGIETTPPDSR